MKYDVKIMKNYQFDRTKYVNKLLPCAVRLVGSCTGSAYLIAINLDRLNTPVKVWWYDLQRFSVK